MKGRGSRPDPLASPSVGTSSDDLIAPCQDRDPGPSRPPAPERGPALAVALSGGGFRATLAGLGVLRLLADAGLLGSVRYLSSVSGGSIASALFAVRYAELRARRFSGQAFDDLVVRPFVEQVTRRSFAHALIWRIASQLAITRRTRVFADLLDEWFCHGRALEGLEPDCRWIFNAANVATGVRFGFERDRLGDYVLGHVATRGTGLRLAEAVAASCAFPAAFAPLTLDGLRFPCERGRPPRLLDGGAYDNLGLEALDGDLRRRGTELAHEPCLVVLNAGGLFRTGRYARIPLVGDVLRTTSLLYRQTTALRTRTMVERFKLWESAAEGGQPPPAYARRGVLFGLAARAPEIDARWLVDHPRPSDAERVRLALISTSLDRMDRTGECLPLIERGWWLTGATLATHQAELLPPPYPAWQRL